jgi:AcrR family transcriptional regulator
MPSTRSPHAGTVPRSPRERLLGAAGERFYAEGVQSVGIDRVIERAGVAKASLSSTFGSKEELVRAYLDERHGTHRRTAADRGRRRVSCATIPRRLSARPRRQAGSPVIVRRRSERRRPW